MLDANTTRRSLSGRYIIGDVRSWPVLAPLVVSRSIPDGPPNCATWPALARYSSTIRRFSARGSFAYSSRRSSSVLVIGTVSQGLPADALDSEHAAERARHAAALRLLHRPVVGEAAPPQRRLERRDPEVAGLGRLRTAQGEQVGVVDDPELPLVDLLPRVERLAAHAVHAVVEDVQRVRHLALGLAHHPERLGLRAAEPV